MSSNGTGAFYTGKRAQAILESSFKNTNDIFFLLRPSQAMDVTVENWCTWKIELNKKQKVSHTIRDKDKKMSRLNKDPRKFSAFGDLLYKKSFCFATSGWTPVAFFSGF